MTDTQTKQTNGKIPEGWQEVKLGDVLERITKGTTPKGFSQNLGNALKGIDNTSIIFINKQFQN